MQSNKSIISNSFISEIKSIIQDAKSQAVRSVEFFRVQMYWKLGERIFTEEQQEKERADYGSYLIRGLAEQIEPEFGSGFSVRQLERSRQFYRSSRRRVIISHAVLSHHRTCRSAYGGSLNMD